MKKFIFSVIILVVFAQAFANAAVSVKTVEVKGFGDSPKKAVDDALYRSVAMAVGVSVDSGDFLYAHDSSTGGVGLTEDGYKFSSDNVSMYSEGTILKNKIKGFIKGYEVVEEGRGEDGKYFALLKVNISEYSSPIEDTKPRLAVVRFTNPSGGLQVGKQLASRLTNTISKQGDYAVVDREHVFQFEQEMGLVVSQHTSNSEKGRIGKVLGADFILTGTIERADVIGKVKHSNATGRDYTEYEARFDVRYSLIVASTRQLKFSDRIEIALENDQVKKLVRDWDYDDVNAVDLKNGLLNLVASRIGLQLSENLSPMRIADVWDDGSILLNMGRGKIAKGMLVDVFAGGREVVDPTSGENLGLAQKHIAKIEVLEVYPKYCFAKKVSGQITQGEIGSVCRVNEQKKQTTTGAKRRTKRKSNGGVVMPFD